MTTNISIMKKDTILKQLSLLKKTLTSQYGVSKIGLFGSVIRGENNKNSDIDILIDFEDGKETYQISCRYVIPWKASSINTNWI